MVAEDLTGQRFGRLTVLRRGESKPGSKGDRKYWWCQCDCKSPEKEIRDDGLKSGTTQSCGCLAKEKRVEGRRAKIEDLTNQQFGRLTVVGPKIINNKTYWHCICLCGNEKYLLSTALKTGATRSCGCYGNERRVEGSLSRTPDLLGQRFGRLIVKEKLTIDNRSSWLCECDCGGENILISSVLLRGLTLSCGCLQRESRKTHGKSKDPVYKVWDSMRARCTNPKHKSWESYGGRGITVCDRWMKSFDNFYEDMGDPPPGMSIERKNNDLGYSPGNCIWATPIEQQNNRRVNTHVEFEGEKYTVSQLARKYGLDPEFLRKRLKRGWSVQDAVYIPAMEIYNRYS